MKLFVRLGHFLILGWVVFGLAQCARATPWSEEKANYWYRHIPEPIGCNFSPSTAINQLEMWQAETFDPVTIDRELGWAEDLGFNSARVFLHNLPWTEDRRGFLKRIDTFLKIAERHHVRIIFVLLDAVWDPFPKLGKQHDPIPGLHNSGWVQSPGAAILSDPARYDELKDYVQGVIERFKNDNRVLAWDLFNEPDNINRPAYEEFEPTNKAELSLVLLKKAYGWAREVNPSQPLTSGVWMGTWADRDKLSLMEKFMLEESDIISFHNYGGLEQIKECVTNLRRYHRPIICTEYMARPQGSTFDPILGYLAKEKVGALNWGFVAGKTQTIYPWDSWKKAYAKEPGIWFHDIFRADGTPFSPREVEYIKSVTGKAVNPSAVRP